MTENKHNGNPLEQLFKDKSDEFNIDFNEADWKDMEQRLDQMDKMLLLQSQNNSMKKRFAAAAIFLIVLTGLGFIIYRSYSKIDKLETKLSQQKIENKSNQILAEDEIEDNQNSIIGRNRSDKNNSPSAKNDHEQKNQFPPNKNNPLAEIQREKKSAHTPGNKREAEVVSNSVWTSNIQSVGIQPADVEPIDIQLSNAITFTTEANNAVISTALGTDYGSSEPTSIENTYNASSAFAVGLTIGPDLSTVGSLNHFYTPGFKIGATVAYSWSDDFAVSSGVIYSKVNYTAQGSEYKPPYGFWKYGIVPQKTTAACAILSIPVRFKYNFVHFKSSRFYVTAGVTSYIMLNESYQFNYARQNESHLIQSWSGHTGTRHWLSNATLSLGYSFDINNTISLGIEPYLNIPIRSVGWGNVELYSMGTLISINYHFH